MTEQVEKKEQANPYNLKKSWHSGEDKPFESAEDGLLLLLPPLTRLLFLLREEFSRSLLKAFFLLFFFFLPFLLLVDKCISPLS